MRKFIATLILLILVVAGSAAYVIYSQNQTSALQATNAKLAQDNQTLTKQRDDALAAQAAKVESLTFTDSGQAIKITYPATWTADLQTIITDITNNDEVVGHLLGQYDYVLTNGDSTLTFHRIYDQVHESPTILDPANQEYKALTSGIMRSKSYIEDDWHYGQLVECAAGVPSTETCYSTILPGFGAKFTTIASFHDGGNDVMEQADNIVLSTLN